MQTAMYDELNRFDSRKYSGASFNLLQNASGKLLQKCVFKYLVLVDFHHHNAVGMGFFGKKAAGISIPLILANP